MPIGCRQSRHLARDNSCILSHDRILFGMSDVQIDAIDRQILGFLQDNARITNAEIAERLGMAASATHERLRKLERRGFIQGYEAVLNARDLGYGLIAYCFVRTNEGARDTVGNALTALEEVQEVHIVAGEDCYLAKVRARDTAHLWRVLQDRIGSIADVTTTRTTIVMQTFKESQRVPLNGDAPAD